MQPRGDYHKGRLVANGSIEELRAAWFRRCPAPSRSAAHAGRDFLSIVGAGGRRSRRRSCHGWLKRDRVRGAETRTARAQYGAMAGCPLAYFLSTGCAWKTGAFEAWARAWVAYFLFMR